MSSSNDCVVIDDCDLTDDEPGPSRMVYKPRACEFERTWFEQEHQRPFNQVVDSSIRSEDISKFQNLIWNLPHDRMVPGYGLTPRELASVSSDGRKGWLVSSHFFWLSRCLNKQQSETRCFVFDPHLRQEAVDKLLPHSSRSHIKTLILIMCVGRRDDGVVFFGTDKMQGDHWSLTVVDVREGTVYYCDTLGWPAPPNLSSSLINYTRFSGLVHTKQLKIKLAHVANTEQHSCTQDCTNYPLQTCSDVCGVVVMICTTVAALDSRLFNLLMETLDKNLNLYLIDPTEYSTYLRYVLISWLARESVDMNKISLRPDFNPYERPVPRALAKKTPLKRKFSTESQSEAPRTFQKNSRLEQPMDEMSSFIVGAKKGGLSSVELLRDVCQFHNSTSAKEQRDKFTFEKLCKGLIFNNAIERCQDPDASMFEFIREFTQCSDNPVLSCKIAGNEFRSKLLDKSDFALVLQTSYQKQLMETYGRQCICVDLIRKSEKSIFPHNLITISVFFDGVHEIPVAWLLSNNLEPQVVLHFFQTVRQNVGPVEADIFIGDLNLALFKQWTQVFPRPKQKKFHTWEALQFLSGRMKKLISNQDTLKSLEKYINVIPYITNVEAFEVYMNAFLVVVKPLSKEFHEYFQEKFLKDSKAEYWATCYRMIPQAKIIPFLRSFYQALKSIDFFGNAAINRVDVVFHKLMQLSIYLERSLIEISSEAKQMSACRVIQRKHQQSSGNFEFYRSTSGEEWCVRASDDSNAFTIVDTGIDDCECPFKCDACKICIHRYVCSCFGYLLNSGACPHIHMLHSLRKVNGAINSGLIQDSFSSPRSRDNDRNMDNGVAEDIDLLKSSTQKELVRLADRIYKSDDVKSLRHLLTELKDLEFNAS